MTENIKNSFLAIVQDSDWMDDETKKHALNKVTQIAFCKVHYGNMGSDLMHLSTLCANPELAFLLLCDLHTGCQKHGLHNLTFSRHIFQTERRSTA